LNAIITPLVKPGSTTDGDVIAAEINNQSFFGGNFYTNDVRLTIYDSTAGGNQRDYIVDIQGAEDDGFNSQKKTNADGASISYNNIGNYDSYSELENTISGLQNQKWSRTY